MAEISLQRGWYISSDFAVSVTKKAVISVKYVSHTIVKM